MAMSEPMLSNASNWCQMLVIPPPRMNTESQEFHRAVGFEETNRIVAYVRKI